MNRKKVDGSLERRFLTAMILDATFLATASGMLDTREPFPQKYANQVAKWCRKYFKKHREAPGKNIETIYHGWVETHNPSEEDADAVHDFLESLSQQFDKDKPDFSTPHLLDELAKYLTMRKITALNDQLTFCLNNGETDDALTAISSFRSAKAENAGYDPLIKDAESSQLEVFAEPAADIFEMPGDAGRFFRGTLTRGGLVAIQAPEKRGKTFWCLEFVFRALRERRSVAVFETGDLTKCDINSRLYTRIARTPLRRDDFDADKGVRYPTSLTLEKTEDGVEPVVGYEYLKVDHLLDLSTCRRALEAFNRRNKIRENSLKFSVHANSTINVEGIDAILQRWKYEEGFCPDLIVIDYADILAPENARNDFRHQVNDTWKALRRMSQEWHACVIVPTQADAASYTAETQSMKNFSEDKRKLGHVTAILGLNQNEEEKDMGVMRLNWLAVRGKAYSSRRFLYVAQCLPYAMAMVKTAM